MHLVWAWEACGAGTSLSNGLKLQASNNSPLKATAKRCILIWLDGGPTHFETFDPKPEALPKFVVNMVLAKPNSRAFIIQNTCRNLQR